MLEARRKGRILLVEDNEEVGEFAESLLSELGHRVSWAKSAEQAMSLARAEGFDAVFTDVVMPGMSGLELADALGRVRPDLPVILTTGYSDEIAETGTGGKPVLLKPYRLETLAAAIDQALAVEGRKLKDDACVRRAALGFLAGASATRLFAQHQGHDTDSVYSHLRDPGITEPPRATKGSDST